MKSKAYRRSGSPKAQSRPAMTASSECSLDMEASSSYSDEDEEDENGGLTQMSSLCPLWDNMLPLDAVMLKSKQVGPHKEFDER